MIIWMIENCVLCELNFLTLLWYVESLGCVYSLHKIMSGQHSFVHTMYAYSYNQCNITIDRTEEKW